MVSTILILAVAASTLVLAWSLLRGGHLEIRNAQDWEQKKHVIDVQIFRALLDYNEARYLHRSLSEKQFRIFQRKRIRLTLGMLRLVEENAGMLIRLGQFARLKRDPALTKQADELTNSAVRFRLNLFLARPCLYVQWLFPSSGRLFAAWDVRYQHLLDSLTRIQQCGWQTLH
jgi:hypothetical protein